MSDEEEEVPEVIEEPEAAEAAASTPEPEPEPPPVRASVWRRALRPPELAPEPQIVNATALRKQTRRSFLLFGAGVAATAAGAWWLLPKHLDSVAVRASRERFLNRALTFDDDVAEALYSRNRLVQTYSRKDVTPLRNNYHNPTPGPGYLSTWSLTLTGLASGRDAVLSLDDLRRLARREQITRLVCVEGWSAIAWWSGVRLADLLAAYPPHPRAKWAAMESGVTDYYVSIDLDTARHPQSLLATHHDGAPLTLAHGAPLRLVVPMKLGLKNIKALTKIAYMENEPRDFWAERGYSKYDGL